MENREFVEFLGWEGSYARFKKKWAIVKMQKS